MTTIGGFSFEEFLERVRAFHGHVAPGVVIGGLMVDAARERLPEGVLYDAICETAKCLPDAVQLLTPCSVGNGWLKIVDYGRYALSLYDKYTGDGVRVFLSLKELESWTEIKAWLFKLKPKTEQNKELLLEEIRRAGRSILGVHQVQVHASHLGKRSSGPVGICPQCKEAYPLDHGARCRACSQAHVYAGAEDERGVFERPPLKAIDLADAVGKRALHDMTEIIPGESKGPAFLQGQTITAGDVCRLERMGRRRIYIEEADRDPEGWVHEDEAALSFADTMAGEGIGKLGAPREGKVTLTASRSGLLVVDVERLEQFNRVPGVMCASRKSYSRVTEGSRIAGTRAIPLYLPHREFERAMAILHNGPLFRVQSMREARIGVLVTGTEVYQGLIEDRFIPLIQSKAKVYESKVVHSLIVPDDREAISRGIQELIASGADLVITTAGLSVDPDDVTRQGLLDAGATNLLYGVPVLPGAMTLLAHIGPIQVMGVPACALYFKTTALDLLLPRLLAGVPIERSDLAKLGHGGFCLECKSCSFPVCPMGAGA